MPNKEDLIYFLSLELENVRCFGSRQPLDLSDGKGNPARWTLLLGDNGVGKTTLLQTLGWMMYEEQEDTSLTQVELPEAGEHDCKDFCRICAPKLKNVLAPKLSREENPILDSLIRKKQSAFTLRAEYSRGKSLRQKYPKAFDDLKSRVSNPDIKTGIEFRFKDDELEGFNLLEKQEVEKVFGKESKDYKEPLIIAYGANRVLGMQNIEESELNASSGSRLAGTTELYDAEEILIRLDHNARVAGKGKANAAENLKRVKEILARVLPDIKRADSIKIYPRKILESSKDPSGVLFKTSMFTELVPLSALSLGYQSTLAWTLDLAWRLFQHYPGTNINPLDQPAIVLIDEIDLHLHPLWQRTIIKDLSSKFKGTQFIATAHSPLMVQSGSGVNLAVLRNAGKEVKIDNDLEIVHGWRVDQLRVDQILNSPLFGLIDNRGPQSEKLFKRRSELLAKSSRTPDEETELAKIREDIINLPNASSMEDIDFMRRATALLERQNEKNDPH